MITNFSRLLQRLLRFLSPGIVEDAPALADAAADGAADAPAAPDVGASPTEAPATMAEAMWNRDEHGRFAPKVDKPASGAQPAAGGAHPVAGAQPAAKPLDKPAAPAVPEDVHQMPEGLGQKAQERFRALSSSVKDLTTERDSLRGQVEYVQQSFQQHGVQQEQFEQAVGFIGAINRGDFASAERMLLGQLQQLSLITGKAYGGAVDPLAEHQDLRQAVDGLQMTEQAAIELARHRQHAAAAQRQQQAEGQQRQEREQHAQAVRGAQADIDAFCKRVAATDMDYPAIEALLLPRIPKLLEGVPPQAWSRIVQAQYDLIKESGATFRRPAAGASSPAPLRATGQGAAAVAPQSMQEAMWGRRLQA